MSPRHSRFAGNGMNASEQVFVKCAWRLIPFMMLLYLLNFLDRVNVGFAALTMNRDLSFTPEIYGFGAGILFFSYAFFQLPANLIFEKLGARRWVFCMLAGWGARFPRPTRSSRTRRASTHCVSCSAWPKRDSSPA
jgi:ACS family tartrate transporter-like MFS transporter